MCRPQNAYDIAYAKRKSDNLINTAQKFIYSGKYLKGYRILREVQEDPDLMFDARVVELLEKIKYFNKKLIKVRNLRLYNVFRTQYKKSLNISHFIDRKNFLIGTKFGSLFLYSIEKKQCTAELKGHNKDIMTIEHSPSGKFAGTVDRTNILRVWDLSKHICIGLFDYPEYRDNIFRNLSISDSGKRAFSMTIDNKVIIWDVNLEEIEENFAIPSNIDIVNSEFYPNNDNKVKLWSKVFTFMELDIASKEVMKEHSLIGEKINSIKNFFVPIIENNEVKIWNLKNNDGFLLIKETQGQFLSAALSPGAHFLVTGDEKGYIKVWELDWDIDITK